MLKLQKLKYEGRSERVVALQDVILSATKGLTRPDDHSRWDDLGRLMPGADCHTVITLPSHCLDIHITLLAL